MTLTDQPLFRFGVLADPQYAAIPPHVGMNRYYANSLEKLSAAIDVFNGEELAFVVTLGDIIDRSFRSFDDILPVYDRLKAPSRLLLGNHDFSVSAERLESVVGRLGLEDSYYDFKVGSFRFIALNGNEVSLFAPGEGDAHRALAASHLAVLKAEGAANAQTWNGALSDTQFAWLEVTLRAAKAAGETVIILNHYPVYPPNEHNLWDFARVLELIEAYDNVPAYFCGHNHAGNFGEHGGCAFVTFKGMVDTPDENTFAIVDVYEDRLEIRGFGREESRTLPLPVPV
ncbi:metallophosphoesterase [Rhizobium sp. LjRoot30]|uniref:metallophosphoesterase n=1 Tax=Rhizobium sp. LjRoot30 TaxID=3342320 RepID=UPI003ECDF2A2